MISFSKNKKGFMMVEVLIVVSIIIVSILAAMAIAEKSIYVSSQSLHSTEAASLLEEGAEVTRLLRDDSWTNISNLTAGTNYYPTFSGSWAFSSTPSTLGIFTRAVTVSDVNRDPSSGDISQTGVDDPGTKLVTVSVSWNESGNVLNKTLSFYLMNIF